MDDLHVARGRLARRSSQFQGRERNPSFSESFDFQRGGEAAFLSAIPRKGPPIGPAYFVAM